MDVRVAMTIDDDRADNQQHIATVTKSRRSAVRAASGRQPVQQPVDELALQEDVVGAGHADSLVQSRRLVARERDQADVRVVAAEPGGGGHAVEQRHVQVEHDRVRAELVCEFDCLEAVLGGPDHHELGLPVDQLLQGLEKLTVIVGDEDADRTIFRRALIHEGKASLAAVPAQQTRQPVAVIGAGLDLGAGRRGVDMGPSAIRYAGLDDRIAELGLRYVDLGDVETAVAEAIPVGDERVRYLGEIKAACERIAGLVAGAVEDGYLPLVLGGDHSVALGTLGGLARARGPGGVLWLDAHGDVNRPETSPSGNVHGMPLAAAMGFAGPEFESDAYRLPAVEPPRVALVGVRSLDSGERELLAGLDAYVVTMSDLDRAGVETALREALDHVAGDGFVHVSLDMDVVDPDVAPGVGTPVRGGLSYREAHLAMELVAESGLASSLEVVEVNPILDRENQTAKLAVELVASALGARIL
jgi:arginase